MKKWLCWTLKWHILLRWPVQSQRYIKYPHVIYHTVALPWVYDRRNHRKCMPVRKKVIDCQSNTQRHTMCPLIFVVENRLFRTIHLLNPSRVRFILGTLRYICIFQFMTTLSNRNICRVAGSLCGEFTGYRWIPLTKASDAELWCFFIS